MFAIEYKPKFQVFNNYIFFFNKNQKNKVSIIFIYYSSFNTSRLGSIITIKKQHKWLSLNLSNQFARDNASWSNIKSSTKAYFNHRIIYVLNNCFNIFTYCNIRNNQGIYLFLKTNIENNLRQTDRYSKLNIALVFYILSYIYYGNISNII